ncbi:MAG: hypothetical protein WD068_00115 [Candidatus Babeliales bacterium]
MEQKKLGRLTIKWLIIILLFSLSIFVEKLYGFRIFLYNSRSAPIRLEVYNQHHCQCLIKHMDPQSPTFLDVGPVLSTCNAPINKIDIYDQPSNTYIGTIQGKTILYNPDIII